MSIPVPCGKCPQCMKRRVSAWSFRLMHEEKHAMSAHFLTLTYSTNHVPITRNGFMTLDKTDVQRWMKRLRKEVALISQVPVKYYACGEYGGRTKRPHYHVILFNVINERIIEKTWNIGAVHYGQVSGASVGYTLKYINKPKKIPLHRNDDRIMEFSLMSKGLGASYVNEKTICYHTADIFNRMCLIVEDGKKIAMPRYIKEKLYTEFQQELLKNHFKFEVPKKLEKERQQYGPDYDWDKNARNVHEFKKQEKLSTNRDKL